MKKIIWIFFALFVTGNALFVLPFNVSSDTVISSSILNYKKDSILLHAVFLDSIIPLKLKMPPLYDAIYYNATPPLISEKKPFLLVNVSFLDNLDFFSLIFPFYKIANLKGEITFFSSIKVVGQPDRDSIALIGNITTHMRVSVKGICTPHYISTLVEKEFASILQKEMAKVEKNINARPSVDSIIVSKPVQHIPVRKLSKPGKKK
ncbi:MAG: hypothetical protein ABIN89_18450 [Chitinophagaceae bacterium]